MNRGKKQILVFTLMFSLASTNLLNETNSNATAKGYVKSLKVSSKRVSLKTGQSKKITYKVMTRRTASKKIVAKVKNSKVVKAIIKRNKIVIKGKKAGTTKLIVTTKGKNKKGKKIRETISIIVRQNSSTSTVSPKHSNKSTAEPHNTVTPGRAPTETPSISTSNPDVTPVPSPMEDKILETTTFDDFSKAASELIKDNRTVIGEGIAEDDTFFARRLIIKSNGEDLDFSKINAKAIIKGVDNIYFVQFSTSNDAKIAMSEISNWSNIVYVEPDSYSGDVGDGESDTSDNTFLSWGVTKIGADKFAKSLASESTTEIKVAVVDTGVSNHSFLGNRRTDDGYDFYDNDSDPSDPKGHGTHVAGTIVDCTPGLDVKIMPVRVLGLNGGYGSTVGMGIRYAADHGAKVINLSLGGEHSNYKDDNIKYAVSKGVTVVVSAGNEYGSIDSLYYCPAHISETICVGAIDSNERKADFSNIGSSLDVVAPGVGIVSCVPGGSYESKSGTSMAAPHISALVAMVKLANPTYTPVQIEQTIKNNCKDLGTSGRDNTYGYGVPDFSKYAVVSPSSISLNKTSVTIAIGKTVALTATITPSDSTDKTVTWSSSNTSVATVNGGIVTGKTEGVANITAETSNGKTAVCRVIVRNGVSTYKLYDTPMSWTEAKEYCENLGGHLVTITSQYENDIVMDLIKTGNKESYWTGGILQEGKWKWCNGEYFEYSSWEDGEPNNYLGRGENCITIRPSTCTWYDSLMTGDPTGIGIESMGFVCEWETSLFIEPTGITLNSDAETINVGDKFSLIATILPNNVTDKTVTWSSSNSNVATVSNGTVIGKSAGVATIKATTLNGKSATCQMTVVDESVIKINNAAELIAISNKLDGNYILTRDIDISDYNWRPIGTKRNPFKGTFDGAGHKITGLTIKGIGEGYQGLFGYNMGILKNINVSGSITISGSLQNVYTGGICAYSEGGAIFSSENLVCVDVDINNTDTGAVICAGGIIGVADMYCTVSECINRASVEASAVGNGRTSSHVGGISGMTASAATMEKCINMGNINAYAMMKTTKYFLTSYAGGITGFYDTVGTMKECINRGGIKAEGYPVGNAEYDCVVGAGGIMGHTGSGIGTGNINESSYIEAIGNEYVSIISKGGIYGY